MDTFNFSIDRTKITVRELANSQNEGMASVDLMSKFLVVDNGEKIPLEQAKEIFLDLNLVELAEVQSQFMEAFLPNPKKGSR